MLNAETIRRSRSLLRCSLGALARNPKLLALPAGSLLAVSLTILLISILLFAPVVLAPDAHSWFDLRHWEPLLQRWRVLLSLHREKPQVTSHEIDLFMSHGSNLVRMGLGFGLMMTMSLLAGLLNAAFYNETMRALAGESVSLRRGLWTVLRRSGPIVSWFIFAGLVGGLFRFVLGRFGVAGKIASAVFGLSWAAAAFFAIPILLRENKGEDSPLKVLRTSAALVKQTWGESVAGYSSFGLLNVLHLVAVALVYFLTLSVGTPQLAGILALGVLLLGSVVSGAAGGAYRCALYIYATEGVVPEPFTEEHMHMAWHIKTPRG